METRHFRLDYNEAVTAKKAMLSSQIDVINAIGNLNRYRITRKKESIAKRELKREIVDLKSKINTLLSYLPKDEHHHLEKIHRKKEKTKEKSKSSKQEIEEIRQKLAKLE